MRGDNALNIELVLKERENYGKLHRTIRLLHGFQDSWERHTRKKMSLLHRLSVTFDINYASKIRRILRGYLGTARRIRLKTYIGHLEEAIEVINLLLKGGVDEAGKRIEAEMLENLITYKSYLERLYTNIKEQFEIVKKIEMRYSIEKSDLISLRNLLLEEFNMLKIEKEYEETLEKIDEAIGNFTEENKKLRLFLFSLFAVPPEKRGLEYMNFLRGCTPEEKAKIISLRRKIRNNRKKILEAVIESVYTAMKKFKDFKGLIIYGSFARAVEIPSDIDAFPISENGLSDDMRSFLNNYLIALTGILFEINEILENNPCPNMLSTWKEDRIFEANGKNVISKYVFDLKLLWWNFIGDPETKEIVKLRIEQINQSIHR